jgi:hypothetical protein
LTLKILGLPLVLTSVLVIGVLVIGVLVIGVLVVGSLFRYFAISVRHFLGGTNRDFLSLAT